MKFPTLFGAWNGKGCRRLDGTQRQVMASLGFDPREMSTAKEICRALGINEQALHFLATEYGLPRFIVRGHVRFHTDLVLAWLRSNLDAWQVFCANRTTMWLRTQTLITNQKFARQPEFIESKEDHK